MQYLFYSESTGTGNPSPWKDLRSKLGVEEHQPAPSTTFERALRDRNRASWRLTRALAKLRLPGKKAQPQCAPRRAPRPRASRPHRTSPARTAATSNDDDGGGDGPGDALAIATGSAPAGWLTGRMFDHLAQILDHAQLAWAATALRVLGSCDHYASAASVVALFEQGTEIVDAEVATILLAGQAPMNTNRERTRP